MVTEALTPKDISSMDSSNRESPLNLFELPSKIQRQIDICLALLNQNALY
jgi:hypothetical protein